jgi:hypothetical protein
MVGWVVNATPRQVYPWERPCAHSIVGWVGHEAGVDGCRKSRRPPGFDPATVHPVASSFTDCATSAHFSTKSNIKVGLEAMGHGPLNCIQVAQVMVCWRPLVRAIRAPA